MNKYVTYNSTRLKFSAAFLIPGHRFRYETRYTFARERSQAELRIPLNEVKASASRLERDVGKNFEVQART